MSMSMPTRLHNVNINTQCQCLTSTVQEIGGSQDKESNEKSSASITSEVRESSRTLTQTGSTTQPSPAMMAVSNIIPSQMPINSSPDKDTNLLRPLVPDGNLYAGATAHQHMEMSKYILSNRVEETFVTTAVAQRAGLKASDFRVRHDIHMTSNKQPSVDEYLRNKDSVAYQWIKGSGVPHSRKWHDHLAIIDKVLILSLDGHPTRLKDMDVVVVAGNEMRIVIGKTFAARMMVEQENDPSPLDSKDETQCAKEVEEALLRLCDEVQQCEELTISTRATVTRMLCEKFKSVWRAKCRNAAKLQNTATSTTWASYRKRLNAPEQRKPTRAGSGAAASTRPWCTARRRRAKPRSPHNFEIIEGRRHYTECIRHF